MGLDPHLRTITTHIHIHITWSQLCLHLRMVSRLGWSFTAKINRLLSILMRYNRDSWIMAPLRIGYVPPFASFPLMMSIANWDSYGLGKHITYYMICTPFLHFFLSPFLFRREGLVTDISGCRFVNIVRGYRPSDVRRLALEVFQYGKL